MGFLKSIGNFRKIKRLAELNAKAVKDYDSMSENDKKELYKILGEFGYTQEKVEAMAENMGKNLNHDKK